MTGIYSMSGPTLRHMGIQIILISAILVLLIVVPVFATQNKSLPSNTIYFDDFENYPSTACTSNSQHCLPGWGSYDNATGTVGNITSWNFFSADHSLLLQNNGIAGAKFDRHKTFAITPGQTRITMTVWFQFDEGTRNINGQRLTEFHISVETLDDSNLHECNVQVFPGTNTGYIIQNDSFNTTLALRSQAPGGTAGDPAGIMANWEWHYAKITMDVTNPSAPTCPFMQVDQTIVSSIGGYLTAATTHAFNSYAGYQKPWRIELATVMGTSQVKFNVWFDDLTILDTSPSTTTCGNNGVNGIQINGGTGGSSTTIQPGCVTINTSSFYMDLGFAGFLAMALTSLIVYRRRVYEFIRMKLRPFPSPSSTEA